MNSIYDQLTSALGQVAAVGQRSIRYRGQNIPCVVLPGNTTTMLDVGGLRYDTVVHVKIQRILVKLGQEGEPHTNEPVTYPAVAGNNLMPRLYKIGDVINDEFSFSFTLTDPTK